MSTQLSTSQILKYFDGHIHCSQIVLSQWAEELGLDTDTAKMIAAPFGGGGFRGDMDCRKGSFSDVYLNIGDISTYKEWTYKTKCGVTVNLALSSGKALIVTDLGNAFVTVNVLAGTDSGFVEMTGPITRANLEALADSFDYTMLK